LKVYAWFLCFALLTTLGSLMIPILNAEEQTVGVWENKTALPHVGGNIRAVAIDEKIYVIHESFTCMYDTVTDTWIDETAMPAIEGRNFEVAVVDTTIYAIGKDINEAYNTLTDTWETKQPPLIQIDRYNLNVVEDKIYTLQGLMYDTVADKWEQILSVPSSVSGVNQPQIGVYQSCVINNEIYVLNENTEVPTIIKEGKMYVYNPKNENWTAVSSIPKLYVGSAVAAVTGQYAPKQIYVIGGCIVHGLAMTTAVNSVYAYNPNNDSWSQVADLFTARSNPAVAVVNDKIYVIGGSLDVSTLTGNPTNVVEVYTPLGYGAIQPSVQESQQPFLTETTAVIAGVAVAATIIAAASITVYHFKHVPLKTSKPS
jgi:hypothetical protein